MYLVKIFQCEDSYRHYDSIALLGLTDDEEEVYDIVQDFMKFKAIEYFKSGNLDIADWKMKSYPVTQEKLYDEVIYPTAPIEYFDIRVFPYSEYRWGKKYKIDLSDVTTAKLLRNIRNYGYNLNELDLSGFELDMDDPEIAELFAE